MKFDTQLMTRFAFTKGTVLRNFARPPKGKETPSREQWDEAASILAVMAVLSPDNKPLKEEEITDTIIENDLFNIPAL